MNPMVKTNCSALGMSNASRIYRMDRTGAAGVAFTAVGLILTAVSYTTYIGGTKWLLAEDNDIEGRTAISKAYNETRTEWTKE